jgi:hypothetical protein
MPRVLVLGQRPQMLDEDEVAAWTRKEAAALLGSPSIRSAEPKVIEVLGDSWLHIYDWLLELEVESSEALEASPLAELLLDLRLLGLRPAVLVLRDSQRQAPPD